MGYLNTNQTILIRQENGIIEAVIKNLYDKDSNKISSIKTDIIQAIQYDDGTEESKNFINKLHSKNEICW